MMTSKAKQCKAMQSKAMQSKAMQCKSNAKQCKAMQCKAKQCKAARFRFKSCALPMKRPAGAGQAMKQPKAQPGRWPNGAIIGYRRNVASPGLVKNCWPLPGAAPCKNERFVGPKWAEGAFIFGKSTLPRPKHGPRERSFWKMNAPSTQTWAEGAFIFGK